MTTAVARTPASTRECGVSLIELMVALVIGLFLILGAVTVYSQSRSSYRTLEAVARVQEKARYALDVLEVDIRAANYWGLNSRSDFIDAERNRDPERENLQVLDELAAVIDDCGPDWAIDLREYVGGSNGDYAALEDCAPSVGDARAGSDVLVVRHAGNEPVAGANSLRPDGLYIQTSRVRGTLFSTAVECDPSEEDCVPLDFLPPVSETHELAATGYFISTASTGDAAQPSLRRKRLVNGANGATIIEEEIMNGVEDLQVQIGLDTDGNADANADLYVDPGDAALAGGTIVAVRLWLRVRADERDFSFADPNVYQYADMTEPAAISAEDRRFRRVLVQKTIHLRNSRTYDQT